MSDLRIAADDAVCHQSAQVVLEGSGDGVVVHEQAGFEVAVRARA